MLSSVLRGIVLRRFVPRGWLALVVASLAAAALAGAAAGGGALVTAVSESKDFETQDTSVLFDRIHAAGATDVRLTLSWFSVAPLERPLDFEPTNPFDPAYDWTKIDAEVTGAVDHGLQPFLVVNGTPDWARTGRGSAGAPPKAADLAAFVRAAAERYSGQYPGLPRVRVWQIWIEPNVNRFFRPQFDRQGRAVAPATYAALVNAAANAIHAVDPEDKVVAGGLSPFTVKKGDLRTIGPLKFMRMMLCMTKANKPQAGCNRRVHFDIWSHHPYTSGGPTHHAFNPDDVSLGDLPEMTALLNAAYRYHHILSSGKPAFWVTEFSWDTNPPDPKALPVKLQARWTAEALYVMWKAGVSLVTWLEIRDDPYPQNATQSGLYYRGATLARDRAKPTFTAFKFPFVAYKQKHGIFVWGRTPWGKPGRVVIEQSTSGHFRRIAVLPTNSFGIVTKVVRGGRTGYLRARLESGGSAKNTQSLSFSLKRPKDRLISIFGSGG